MAAVASINNTDALTPSEGRSISYFSHPPCKTGIGDEIKPHIHLSVQSPKKTSDHGVASSAIMDHRRHSGRHELESPAATIPDLFRRKFVEGNVVRPGDQSVLCELKLATGPVSIHLQRGIFEQDVKVGDPILLSLEEVNGYKRFIVTKRELPSGHVEASMLEMARFLD